MAVAAGAAVLAGAKLGRKGLAGIAAGVAALAGAKLFSGARNTESAPSRDDTSDVVDLSPEVHSPTQECADWVDHDAVNFSHIVPDSAEAAEMLKEKHLPLLDDDGKPVEFFTLEPEFSKSLEPEPPLGPIIWKPGRFPQSASAGTSETVWFGMKDATPEVPAQQTSPPPLPARGPSEIATPLPPSISEPAPSSLLAAPSVLEEAPWPPVAVPPPIPLSVGLSAITGLKPASAPAGQNPFLAPVASQVEPPPGPPLASTAIPFPSGAFGASPLSFMAAADAAAAPVVAARPAAKSCLPQPRRPGELPKHMICRTPGNAPASLSAQNVMCEEPAGPPQRHLERLAPVMLEPEERRWPLLILLCLVIAIGVAIAADRWQDGALLRKVEAMPWFQKSLDGELTVSWPTASPPASTTEPAKRGSWIDPSPEPVK
jgi:hypothetical protein